MRSLIILILTITQIFCCSTTLTLNPVSTSTTSGSSSTQTIVSFQSPSNIVGIPDGVSSTADFSSGSLDGYLTDHLIATYNIGDLCNTTVSSISLTIKRSCSVNGLCCDASASLISSDSVNRTMDITNCGLTTSLTDNTVNFNNLNGLIGSQLTNFQISYQAKSSSNSSAIFSIDSISVTINVDSTPAPTPAPTPSPTPQPTTEAPTTQSPTTQSPVGNSSSNATQVPTTCAIATCDSSCPAGNVCSGTCVAQGCNSTCSNVTAGNVTVQHCNLECPTSYSCVVLSGTTYRCSYVSCHVVTTRPPRIMPSFAHFASSSMHTTATIIIVLTAVVMFIVFLVFLVTLFWKSKIAPKIKSRKEAKPQENA